MFQKIMKYLFWGIAWGCTYFVLSNLIGVLLAEDLFLKPVTDDFVNQALGAVLVGICCGSSAIVYTFEKMAFWKKIGLHASIGLSGYFITAFKLGWVPIESSFQIFSYILIGILIFVGIWFCFYFYNRQEAKKVNQRLKELEQELKQE